MCSEGTKKSGLGPVDIITGLGGLARSAHYLQNTYPPRVGGADVGKLIASAQYFFAGTSHRRGLGGSGFKVPS